MKGAYYNEIDPYCAAWLRNLISAGHIAPGEVDERSIVDVRPADLRGFTQCHFFAGIGVWSYALRSAGWPDDRPVWTGSCPCQPFSAAGKGNGFADERHLWPSFHHLIHICRPSVVFGEQVASKDGLFWLDLVQTDMEAKDYAIGAVDTCAAGFGAPHIRQRLYWVADSNHQRREHEQDQRPAGVFAAASTAAEQRNQSSDNSAGVCEPADAGQQGLSARERENLRGTGWGIEGRAVEQCGGTSGGLGIAYSNGRQQRQLATTSSRHGDSIVAAGDIDGPGQTNGYWRDADWLFCRDGKWRPVEPGTSPLVNGAPSRVGRLRAYGNAINAAQAQGFIEAYMECQP